MGIEDCITLISTPEMLDFSFKLRDELNAMAKAEWPVLVEKVRAQKAGEVPPGSPQDDPLAERKLRFLRSMEQRFREITAALPQVEKEIREAKLDVEYWNKNISNFGSGPYYIVPVGFKYFADSTRLETIYDSVRGTEAHLIAGFDKAIDTFPSWLQDALADPKKREEFYRVASPKATAVYQNLCTAYALREADVGRLIGIFPKMAGTRQDKKKGRQSVHAAVFSSIYGPVMDKIVTLDLHNQAICSFTGFRPGEVENLYSSKVSIPYLMTQGYTFILSADAGGAARADHFGKVMGLPTGAATKFRDHKGANKIEKILLGCNVVGHKVLIPEDMIDSGGTVKRITDALFEAGAAAVGIAGVHGLFNPDAISILDGLRQKYKDKFNVYTTTSIYHKNLPDWIHIISITELIAPIILNLHTHGSLSGLYMDMNHTQMTPH